jgi:hypothetical protein
VFPPAGENPIAVFTAFVSCIAGPIQQAVNNVGGVGATDAAALPALHLGVTGFLSEVMANALSLLEYGSITGADAQERSVFWMHALTDKDVVSALKTATQEFGKLDRVASVSQALRAAISRSSTARTTELEAQLAAAAAAAAVAAADSAAERLAAAAAAGTAGAALTAALASGGKAKGCATCGEDTPDGGRCCASCAARHDAAGWTHFATRHEPVAMNAAQKEPTSRIKPPATLLPAPPTSLPPPPLPTTGLPGPSQTAPTSAETTAWITQTLDALAAGGGDMPFLDISDTTEDTTVEHQRMNADTQAHMLASACNSFEDWAVRTGVPVDCGPLAGTIRAYAPAIVAGEERLAVDVQRSGCVTLPP